jgi:hypothetical protein
MLDVVSHIKCLFRRLVGREIHGKAAGRFLHLQD